MPVSPDEESVVVNIVTGGKHCQLIVEKFELQLSFVEMELFWDT